MSEQWLRCSVSKGMFSDELVIVVTTASGESAEYFVPEDFVERMQGEAGRIRVQVFEKDNLTWAVLPTENRESIPIQSEDLVAA